MAIPRNLANIAPHVNASSTELVVNDGGANLDFRVEGDTNANLLFVDAGADAVGISTSSPDSISKLTIASSTGPAINFKNPSNNANAYISNFFDGDGNSNWLGSNFYVDSGGNLQRGDTGKPSVAINLAGRTGDGFMRFYTGTNLAIERARITSGGDILFNNTTASSAANMMYYAVDVADNGHLVIANTSATDNLALIYCNRQASDGKLIEFRQANVAEGTISVSGSTVTYGGGHLARWGQLLDGSKDESLKKGTVLSNLDEMCVWSAPTTYWTEEDELPVDEEGNPTVAVGDVKKEAYTADNEQCNKIKVSDVDGDANVAGVFVSWIYDEQHNTNDLFVAMTGDMIIRIAEGVTVARGDLLTSAGDGTAKPQGDDIVRSKTIAKVTSTHVTCTYEDGSYCVPCVLMAC